MIQPNPVIAVRHDASACGGPAGVQRSLHWLLRRQAMSLHSRSVELATALQRFRDRQVQINAGLVGPCIAIPPVAAVNWFDGNG